MTDPYVPPSREQIIQGLNDHPEIALAMLQRLQRAEDPANWTQYTDDELDLLRANLYAERGLSISRREMLASAQLLPPDYLDRLKEVLAQSGKTVADLDLGERK